MNSSMAVPLSLPLGFTSKTSLPACSSKSSPRADDAPAAPRARRAPRARARRGSAGRGSRPSPRGGARGARARARRSRAAGSCEARAERGVEVQASVGRAALGAVLAGDGEPGRGEERVDVGDGAAADQGERAARRLAPAARGGRRGAASMRTASGRSAWCTSVPSMSRKTAACCRQWEASPRFVARLRCARHVRFASRARRRAGAPRRRAGGGCACAPRRGASARPSGRR